LPADRFRIFLASPSGLDDYRRAARDQFEQIRTDVASRCGIDVDAIGWEDISPGFGRPQSVINPKLDTCNVLVGILGKQLGTPTGVAASGFVEEYDRMAARARTGEDVAIWVYLLPLPDEALADPGEKLKAVLEFRERLFDEALVKLVRNIDDFGGQLYRDLNSLVLDADERRRQRSESAAAPVDNEERQAPKQDHSGEAGRQLRELLTAAAKEAPLPPQTFLEEGLPLARLGLWVSAWDGWAFAGEIFGVHPLNRLYTMRDSVALAEQEKRHVLRSMCGQRSVAPGWALMRYSDDQAAAALVTVALGDRRDDIRAAAFRMLDKPLLDAWLANNDDVDQRNVFAAMANEIDRLNDFARDAMIDFAARYGGAAADDFLSALTTGESGKQQAWQALIRLRVSSDLPGAIAAVAEAEIEPNDKTISAFRAAVAGAEVSTIERLASAPSVTLRLFAVEVLGTRDPPASGVLKRLLDDPSNAVALAAFAALYEVDGMKAELAAASARLQQRESLRYDDRLSRGQVRQLDTEQLIQSLNWIDIGSINAYRVLAEERWDEFGPAVRRDLADGFRTFAEKSRALYARRLGPQ